jgi:hypothetical protein
MNLNIAVYRYNPDVDAKPYMKDYTLEVEEGTDMMVLDALILLKEKDSTLAFRRSCREGVCGSDGLNMNGKNGLACITPISSFKGKKLDDLDPNVVEKDLTFIGLIGMIDPPRIEVKQSIEECVAAGIKPVMITGDHLNTAVAIAKNLGIMRLDDELAITGVQLDELSDEYLNANIENYSVFARVSPENKIRIVKA